MYEEIAFNLVEMGHSPQAIMSFEITFLLGYALKRFERNEKAQEQSKKTDPDGWTTQGNKRRKTMTSQQALAKVRNRK